MKLNNRKYLQTLFLNSNFIIDQLTIDPNIEHLNLEFTIFTHIKFAILRAERENKLTRKHPVDNNYYYSGLLYTVVASIDIIQALFYNTIHTTHIFL